LRRVSNGDDDDRLSPYISGPALMDFFRQFGFQDRALSEQITPSVSTTIG
jgi:hypothetical protein